MENASKLSQRRSRRFVEVNMLAGRNAELGIVQQIANSRFDGYGLESRLIEQLLPCHPAQTSVDVGFHRLGA